MVNYLLDHEMLIFRKSDLLFGKVTRSRGVKKIQEEYLSLSFDKPVVIFRIIDSKSEKFKLDPAYRSRYEQNVFDIITRPEIEILIIIKNGDYERYSNKHKSKTKPSEYCQAKYGIKKIKSEGKFILAFDNQEQLISSITLYKRFADTNEHTLNDLLKKKL